MSKSLPPEDVRLLALLVHQKKIAEQQARAAMGAAQEVSLSIPEWLVKEGHLAPGEWESWRRAGGEPPRLKGYEITGRLGEGGCAVVYLARDRDGQEVALKVARSEVVEAPLSREQFVSEGKLLCQLRHGGIVHASKVAKQGKSLYLVLEYVPGETVLDRLLRKEIFGEAEALPIVLDVARALGYLSTEGIVHRDVKPGNIMLPPQGGVKLLDLGFALTDSAGAIPGDDTSGTAHYMAPEQAKGEDVDARSDIYSLGVSLFHMVTGELPFNDPDKRAVMRAQIKARLSSAALKDRSFTPLLAYFVQKMTAKEREIRYQNPGELIVDLEKKTRGFTAIREQGRVQKIERLRKKPTRRRRKRR